MFWIRHSHHAAPAPTAAPDPIRTSDIVTGVALEDAQRDLDAALAQVVDETRHDAGRVEVADLLAAVPAGLLVAEDVLQERRARFHAGDLRDRFDAADTVVAAAHVNDVVERADDLLADRARRELEPRH